MTSPRTAYARRIDRLKSSSQRGATLTGYALLVALLTVTSLAAIEALGSTSSDYLDETGEQVGTARQSKFDANAGAPGGGGGGGGGAPGTGVVPPGPATVFPPGIPTPPGVPAPTLVSGDIVFPTGGGVPPTADLSGNGPWDDDQYSFIFTEATWTQVGPLTVAGETGPIVLQDGVTYCSYIYHFSPVVNEAFSPPTTIDFQHTVVGVAGSTAAMEATDDITPNEGSYAPTSAYPHDFENNDNVSVNGSEVTFDVYAVTNGADNARIITECPGPAPAGPTPVLTNGSAESGHAPGMCLVESAGVLAQRPCDNTQADQQWDVNDYGGGVAEIVSHNGLCLGVAGHGNSNDDLVVEVPCGSPSSTWTLTGAPSLVENINAPGKCMDVPGSATGDVDLIIFDCHGGPNQTFNFQP